MNYYHLCCQHKGKVVSIYEKSGRVHVGKIEHVDQEYVWLSPTSQGPRGFGYGYHGYGYDAYSYGGGYPAPHYGGYPQAGYGGSTGHGNPSFAPVALAAVGGLALGAAFFW